MDSGHGKGELEKMMWLGGKMCSLGWIVAKEKVCLGK